MVTVNNPSGPHGEKQDSFNISNNNSTTGRAFLENDVLLFEITNDIGDAETCQVDLSDVSGNGPLGTGSISWSQGTTGTQCIEFSNFPTDADGNSLGSCNYEISLTNDGGDSGVKASVSIYRG